jgi:hypothetical protein
VELYIHNKWTACYGDSYIAEAIAWSESGYHVSIYSTEPQLKRRTPNS